MATYKTEDAARKAAEDEGLQIASLSFTEGDDGWSYGPILDGTSRVGTAPLRPGEQAQLDAAGKASKPAAASAK